MVDKSVISVAFCEALNAMKDGWRATDDGIVGPEDTVVRFMERHEGGPGHVDVQFVWREGTPQQVVLWDCVTGLGSTPVEWAQTAAHLWSSTTAGTLLELVFSRQGEFADHFHGNDKEGLLGWHVIAGAIIGYGDQENAARLQNWFLSNPVLPALTESLGSSLEDETGPHGIKVYFGAQSIVEIRVDGERHEAASDALAALSWPRLTPAALVRSYFIALHREN